MNADPSRSLVFPKLTASMIISCTGVVKYLKYQ